MTEAPLQIDFKDIEGPVYTGRSRGEQLREVLHLDEADRDGRTVKVTIPAGTFTISSSFFLGLFGPSVMRAGSTKAFFDRYQIESPDYLKEAMDSYVQRALQPRNLCS